MVWAQRRKLAYMSGVILFFGIVGFFVVRHYTNVPPTCFDRKQNGAEAGVDCGGGCLQYCPNELSDPKVRWTRSFQVTPGVVTAIAYIEHSYPTASSRKIRYQFKLYDSQNSLITERIGTTYLGPMGKSAIVENLIPTGNNQVAVTRFSFLPPVPWEKSDPSFSKIIIKTDRSALELYSEGTRLTTTLDNQSRFSFANLEIVAILYDQNSNAIAVSKILLPELLGLSKQTVYFTWPTKIEPKNVQTIEVIPRFNIFAAKSL